ncbi:hypothetical protein PsYK624_051470 [Phanerochaete sordida]|uniref:Uncharacterized protein n=1 Tax=Phanerochaete sordida TaxID=48140 RepID=A0A9P3G6P5_9APHY|nr:hypothetical protein PsYK624_051470 [Phanerochaete sordida]
MVPSASRRRPISVHGPVTRPEPICARPWGRLGGLGKGERGEGWQQPLARPPGAVAAATQTTVLCRNRRGCGAGRRLAGEPPSVVAGRYLEWEAAITELEKEAHCTVPRVGPFTFWRCGSLQGRVRVGRAGCTCMMHRHQWSNVPARRTSASCASSRACPDGRRQAGGSARCQEVCQAAKHPSVSNGHSFCASGRPGGSRPLGVPPSGPACLWQD